MPESLSMRAVFAMAAIASVSTFAVQTSIAAPQYPDNVTITTVSVNGGADTQNPGTTCVTVSIALPAACQGGFVAIPNNNKLLIAAALQAKATNSKVAFYFDDTAGPFHCAGHVFTPCSVISIQIK